MAFLTKFTITQTLVTIFLVMLLLVGSMEFVTLLRMYDGQDKAKHLSNSMSPTVVANTRVLSGLERSFSLLESWILFGDEKFHEDFLSVWNEGIYPPFEKLSTLS